MDKQKFFEGLEFFAYDFFGAHIKKDGGVIFRVYAPKADDVMIVGDFNSWRQSPMQRDENGIYTYTSDTAKTGDMYKYRVYSSGEYIDHCDPYGFAMELRPRFASIVTDMDDFEWNDREFMQNRTKSYENPLNIYEIHLGSWRMKDAEKIEDRWYTYEELIPLLIPYLKEQGYNAVEFMPVCEHPVDISWGYQNTGFYAPTSRYGTPKQLKLLIEALHRENIKVILDFVLVHFATDNYALEKFDGGVLYEHAENGKTISEWGSYNFNYSKGEVRSFLQSAANFWLSEYHFDGLRVDAVSRLIYWHGNSDLGLNEPGLVFIKYMNYRLHEMHPSAMLIAEDSTDYSKVTVKVEHGGMGFDYKWDMGWMNDTLDFFKKTPGERIEYYNTISFSMMYFHSEKFMMALSHDENVHGKATILNKMYGSEFEDKFAQARAFYMYMYTHPGKKLIFMGSELGQIREWDETQEQDFMLLKFPIHDSFNHYIMELNRLYLSESCLNAHDYDKSSFEWNVVNDADGVTYAYTRKSQDKEIFVAFNFSDIQHPDYYFKFDKPCKFRSLLSSDWDIYSGNTPCEKGKIYECFPIRKAKYEQEISDLETELVRLDKLKKIEKKRAFSLEKYMAGLEVDYDQEKELQKKLKRNLKAAKTDSEIKNAKYELSLSEEKAEDFKNQTDAAKSEANDAKASLRKIEDQIRDLSCRIDDINNTKNPDIYDYILSLDLAGYSGRMFEIIKN